jgi:hypothetical protein
MQADRKTVVGAVAAVAVGAIGAAVAYNTLRGDGADNDRKRAKPSSAKNRRAEQAQSGSVGTVNINQAPRDDLLRLKHSGKGQTHPGEPPLQVGGGTGQQGASPGRRSGAAPGSSDGVMLPSL